MQILIQGPGVRVKTAHFLEVAQLSLILLTQDQAPSGKVVNHICLQLSLFMCLLDWREQDIRTHSSNLVLPATTWVLEFQL